MTRTPRGRPAPNTVAATSPLRVFRNLYRATRTVKKPKTYCPCAPLHGHVVSSACFVSASRYSLRSLGMQGPRMSATRASSLSRVPVFIPVRRDTVPTVMWWR